MAAPCRKCGTTKTEPVRPGLRLKLARQLGYELRSCARCRKLRLLSRRKKRPANTGTEPEQINGAADPSATASPASQDPAAFYDPDGFNGCPRCGEMRFHRSRRNWLESAVLRRPPMVRCSECGYRFPAPQL